MTTTTTTSPNRRLHRIIGAALAAGLAFLPLPHAGAAPKDAGPSLSLSDITVAEGTGGITTAQIQLTMSKASGRIVTVEYRTGGGTATPGQDYAVTVGTLTLNKQQTAATLTVPIVADSLDEPDEDLEVRLSNPGGGARIGDGIGRVVITDDDTAAPPPEDAVDLSVGVSATSSTGGDHVVSDAQRVAFALTNSSGQIARDVRLRLTFDASNAPTIVEELAECAPVTPSEILCSYGDDAASHTGELSATYSRPGAYSIVAVVESLTDDPAPGNNIRTAVVPVRNRRADLKANDIIGFDTSQQALPPLGDAQHPTAWQDPFIAELPHMTPYQSQVDIEALGPDPVDGATVAIRHFAPSGSGSSDVVVPSSFESVHYLRPGGFEIPDCAGEGTSTLTCRLPRMAPGEHLFIAFEFDPEDSAEGIHEYVADVTATLLVPSNPDGSAIDPDPTNDVEVERVSAIKQERDLHPISHRAPPGSPNDYQIRPNSELSITAALGNRGPASAHESTLSIRVPVGGTFVRAENTGWSSCTTTREGLTTLYRCTLSGNYLARVTQSRPSMTVTMRFALIGNYEVPITAASPSGFDLNPVDDVQRARVSVTPAIR